MYGQERNEHPVMVFPEQQEGTEIVAADNDIVALSHICGGGHGHAF